MENKYFIYARKSTESEDRQILSIESQLKEANDLAKRYNLKVIDILTEAKSAKAPGRPIFNQMIERIKKEEAVGIICWKLNRLARNPVDGGQIIWLLQQGIIKHIITAERSYYPDDNTIPITVEFGMANQYVRDLTRDTKRGLKAKLEKGWIPCMPPLGWLNNQGLDKSENAIIKDPERFHLIRKMWELMLTGIHTPPKIQEIVNNEWGFRTRISKRTGGKPLSRSAIYKIFTNPFYYGMIEYNGELCSGKHEPMVTKEEFDRVQLLLGRKGNPRPKTHTFAFTGEIKCAECGASVTAEVKTKICKSGEIHYYIYYHCTKRKKGVKCSQRAIRSEDLERQIKEILSKLNIDNDFLNLALKYLSKIHEDKIKDENTIKKSIETAREGIEKQLDNLTGIRLKGLIDDQEYIQQKNKLLTEKTQLEEKLGNTGYRQDNWKELSEKSFNFAHHAPYWFDNGSLIDKKTILHTIGSNCILKDRKLSISLKNPWLIIKEGLEKVEQEKNRLEPLQSIENKGENSCHSLINPYWLPGEDSNLKKQTQILLCYQLHYRANLIFRLITPSLRLGAIRLRIFPDRKSGKMLPHCTTGQ